MAISSETGLVVVSSVYFLHLMENGLFKFEQATNNFKLGYELLENNNL